jgi:hypothetical protein
MKVVINRCYGGFGLSKAAYEFMGLEWDGFGNYFGKDRTDPKLIECVETLGSKVASDRYAALEIVEIPDDISWHIHEYDGYESIKENHRSW